MRIRRAALLAVAAALLTGAGCGGDDDDGGAGDDTTEDGSGDAVPDGGFEGEGCTELAETVAGAESAALNLLSGNGDFERFGELFDRAAEEAPLEVADAVQVLADAYDEIVESLEDAGVDLDDRTSFQDPDAIAALSEASEVLSTPEFNAASEELRAFVAAGCPTT